MRLPRWLSVLFSRRMLICMLVGFSSGLPLALTAGAMQAWLTRSGGDMVTIGFLGLVGLPYTFKFLWSPLMDRFDLPWLGRRRGWLLLSQLLLALALFALAHISPAENLAGFAILAGIVAFLSASQDVVIDAYRTELLPHGEERGLGASLHVFGYRLAMVVSGGLAFIWAAQWQSWPRVYMTMAGMMLGLALLTLLLAPRLPPSAQAPTSTARHDLFGFIAMLAGAWVGYRLAELSLQLLGFDPESTDKWIRLLFVLLEIGVALPCAWIGARLGQFETLVASVQNYFTRSGATAFLLLIVLYKLGDAFAGSLTTPFLIQGMGYSEAEVGIANKIIGLWLTIFGAFLGGLIMLRLKLFRALLLFGILQLASNAGFYVLAVLGKGAWGSVMLQPFDGWFMALKQPAALDWLLLAVVAGENITGGMGTVAFVGLLMSLCNQRYTATHYAMLSAFAAVGRIYVSPLSGVLSIAWGWPGFFLFSVLIAVPGVLIVWWMRKPIHALMEA